VYGYPPIGSALSGFSTMEAYRCTT